MGELNSLIEVLEMFDQFYDHFPAQPRLGAMMVL